MSIQTFLCIINHFTNPKQKKLMARNRVLSFKK